MYLPILVDLFLECTIVCDGIKIHYTDIIAEFEKDIISWNSGIGLSSQYRFLCGTFSSVVVIYFQVSTFHVVSHTVTISWKSCTTERCVKCVL